MPEKALNMSFLKKFKTKNIHKKLLQKSGVINPVKNELHIYFYSILKTNASYVYIFI